MINFPNVVDKDMVGKYDTKCEFGVTQKMAAKTSFYLIIIT